MKASEAAAANAAPMPATQAPAEGIEGTAQHEAADQSTAEIAGEVEPARRSAIAGGRPADKTRRDRLREERADADQD